MSSFSLSATHLAAGQSDQGNGRRRRVQEAAIVRSQGWINKVACELADRIHMFRWPGRAARPDPLSWFSLASPAGRGITSHDRDRFGLIIAAREQRSGNSFQRGETGSMNTRVKAIIQIIPKLGDLARRTRSAVELHDRTSIDHA